MRAISTSVELISRLIATFFFTSKRDLSEYDTRVSDYNQFLLLTCDAQTSCIIMCCLASPLSEVARYFSLGISYLHASTHYDVNYSSER